MEVTQIWNKEPRIDLNGFGELEVGQQRNYAETAESRLAISK